MIESLILRKLAVLSQSNKCNRYANFDYQKEKEIVVWVRLQQGLDKEQVVDFIKSKFNTTDLDANRIYYIAYPQGVSYSENQLFKAIDLQCTNLPITEANPILDDCCQVLLKEKRIEEIPQYKVNLPLLLDNLEILLKNRNLI